MKKIFLGSLLSLSFLFVGCDEGANDGRFEPSPKTGWVEFEEQGHTAVPMGQETVTIPVHLEVPINQDGILVTYTVTHEGGVNLMSEVSYAGEVLIPGGSRFGYIVMDVNPDITECGDLLITLEATNNAEVSVGLSDGSQSVTHLVKIVKNRDMILGVYDVIEDGTWEYQVEVEAGDAANEIVIKGLYDIAPTTETRMFLDYQNGRLVYPPFIENLLFTSSVPEQGNVYVTPVTNQPSTFDSCEGMLNLSFRLVFGPTQESQTAVINAVMTRVSDN